MTSESLQTKWCPGCFRVRSRWGCSHYRQFAGRTQWRRRRHRSSRPHRRELGWGGTRRDFGRGSVSRTESPHCLQRFAPVLLVHTYNVEVAVLFSVSLFTWLLVLTRRDQGLYTLFIAQDHGLNLYQLHIRKRSG